MDQQRADVTAELGLTAAEVVDRVAAGHVNVTPEPPGRSFGQIVAANVFTVVNAIMLTLFVLVLVSGNPKDALFVGVVVSNSVIGVVQEVRARRELQRLEVVTEPRVTVIRDRATVEIPSDEIVLDDVVELRLGGQVAVDGELLEATALRLDESMLTGESLPVPKEIGDPVMSGSFVVAGNGRLRATAVGADSYASTLATEAKQFTAAQSQLRQGIDIILRWLTVIIPVASIFLFINLLSAEDGWQDALLGTVAAAVAMVPDGLVLLTSLSFMAGIVALARRNALAKQLSTVEVLARVDVLCLDKTGTITTGEITFAATHTAAGRTDDEARDGLVALASSDRDPNASMAAIVAAVGTDTTWEIDRVEPFDSGRKWSAASFVDRGWVYLGAPDFLLAPDDPARDLVERLSTGGKRLLAVMTSLDGPAGDRLPEGSRTLAIVELEDEIRPDAAKILSYFAEQDVTLKVISGDNQDTVAAIADRAGLTVAGPPVDARELPTDLGELATAMDSSTVFGRVKPQQKQAMVQALQSRGHVVAMTGDGVNDVLALKDADLGISMGSGSEATKAVADLVLTDNAFSSLPTVVNEGRKVINNIERVSNLFVTKAAYAVLLTFAVGLLNSPFPFLPRQLTLIGTFSIGVPGFFLALAPEVDLIRPGFLRRVLWFSVPAGVIAGSATLAAYEAALHVADLGLDESRTLATVTLLAIGLVVLAVASRPVRSWKLGLVVAMAVAYLVVFAVPWIRNYFALELFWDPAWFYSAIAVAVAGVMIVAIPLVIPTRTQR
ncbi:MAG TPA: HAD-IC family P-type ATPase [Ilumatobacteraceae bacterium]|nr:HAD-IC family P-type ATPase [Ilumatobacteraceae bacterium]